MICQGTNLWPRETSYPHSFECPKCGQPFSRAALQGRDDHLPPHEPMRASDHDAAETVTGVQ